MSLREVNWRFWTPVILLVGMAYYSGQKLVRAHIDPEVSNINYEFERMVLGQRGAIYSCYGREYPLVKSVPYWEYALDPVALTNGVVRPKGEKPRTKQAIVKTIAEALGLKYEDVKRMADREPGRGWRSQFLARSTDPDVHGILANSRMVAGVAINDRQVREYLHGRSLAHVLGAVNAEHVGSCGLEQKFNDSLSGQSGLIRGMKDAKGRELYDRRIISLQPVPGDDVYLTIDHNIQFECEEALRWGIAEYGAGSGWAIVMDSRTGAIMAMCSMPDFDPPEFGKATESMKLNRAIGFVYEPGSVMKVITACAAVDSNPRVYGPNTVFRTNRDDERYYKLPRDEGHVWEATMTLKDAIVHSSNIVIGKLAYDLGPSLLYQYMKKFGLGVRTGIELPGEEAGILPIPSKWDKASWSRAGIGQFVAVTGIQLISAYQAIANEGVRMKPYLVNRVVGADGKIKYQATTKVLGYPISRQTADTVKKMMLDVASPKGTARRAAVRGYSVAGKTGTAQKQIPGVKGYAPGLFRASFCGIVPAADPRLVILVSLDFDERTKYHQGGNSSGPVFRRIAKASLRYLSIPPDRPEELEDAAEEDDEIDQILENRARRGIERGN